MQFSYLQKIILCCFDTDHHLHDFVDAIFESLDF